MLIDFILDRRNLCQTPARPGDEPAVAAESATTLKYMVLASLQKLLFTPSGANVSGVKKVYGSAAKVTAPRPVRGLGSAVENQVN
jgi:hypothetical protein